MLPNHLHLFFWEFSLQFWCPVLIELFIFLMFRFLLFWFFLYSRLQSPVRWIAGKRFLHSVGCLFAHLTVSFVVQKPLKFSRPHLSNVDLISCAAKPFWKLLPEPRSWTVPPPLSSSNFRVTRPYAKVLEALRPEHYARWENRTWLVFLRVRYNFPKTICWGMLSFFKKKNVYILASFSAMEWLLDFLWLLSSTPLVDMSVFCANTTLSLLLQICSIA